MHRHAQQLFTWSAVNLRLDATKTVVDVNRKCRMCSLILIKLSPLQIVIIEHKSIICPGYNAVLHIHTCIEEVQITVKPDARVTSSMVLSPDSFLYL